MSQKIDNALLQLPFFNVDVPPVVYKYRNWGIPEHKTILTKQELYFAQPSSFKGDKYDCKIPFRHDLVTDNLRWNWFLNYSLRENYGFTIEQHLHFADKHLIITPSRNIDHQKDVENDFWAEQDRRLGVLSLSISPTEKKMWKYFAANRKGFCVGYSSEKLLPLNTFGTIGRVQYYNENSFPVIMPIHLNPDDRLEDMITNVYHLRSKFKYQSEFRVTKLDLLESERSVVVPKDSIVEVILGDMMEPTAKAEILDIVRQLYPWAKVFEAKLVKDKFELVPISI